jgi:predicted MPP superfamily phosphohydrolase
MTLNPETGETKLFISRQNGALVQLGGAQSQAEDEYYNPYTQAAIDERIDEIKALQYGDTITFAVITDIHYRADELSRAGIDSRIDRTKDFQMLAKQIPIDFIAFTGDVLQESAAFDAIEPRMMLMSETLNKAKAPVYFERGNHDLNSSDVFAMTNDLL